MAESISNLQDLVTIANEKGIPYGMEINISKRKAMVVIRKDPVPEVSALKGKQSNKQAARHTWDTMATEDGRCEKKNYNWKIIV